RERGSPANCRLHVGVQVACPRDMRFRAAQPDLMGAVKSLPDKKDPPKRVSVLGDTGQFLRRLSRALYSPPHAIGAANRGRVRPDSPTQSRPVSRARVVIAGSAR